MDVESIEKKLLHDIEVAYSEAINIRLQNINDSINDIIGTYKQAGISLYSIINLDSVKDYKQIQFSPLFPFLIKLGYYRHKRFQNIPNQIPFIINLLESKGLNVVAKKNNFINACNWIQNVTLRLILSLPDDLIDVHLFDTTSNGANFSFLLALDKVKQNLLTSDTEISNKLSEITSSFTKIQTEKLTFQYQSVQEYNNSNTGKIPYKVIIISGYPEGFMYKTETIKFTKQIIENGAKFGVVLLMVSDQELLDKRNYSFTDDISKIIGKVGLSDTEISSTTLINELDKLSIDFNVEPDINLPIQKHEIVSYLNTKKQESEQTIAEKNKKTWGYDWFYDYVSKSNDFWSKSSAENVVFPIGFPINYSNSNPGYKLYTKNLNKEYAYFHFGKEVKDDGSEFGEGNYHCLIGGETGSGKSVLINNLIINSCYLYSPEELQYYIIDLKGSGYLQYSKLPHIKVLFQDPSKIEVALNILQFIQKQFEERVKLFQKARLDEFPLYRLKNKLPRIICVIDEFQTFNQSSNGDVKKVSTEIIDLIAGKGRAYGIHLILASQSLSNAKIEDASKSNINVRLVLRLDEPSSKQILSSGNNETLKFPDLQLVYNNIKGYEKSDNKVIKLPFLKGNLISPHIDLFNKHLTTNLNLNVKKYLLPGEPEVYIESNTDLYYSLKNQNSSSKRIYLGQPYFIKEEDSFFELQQEMENNVFILGQDLKTSHRILALIILQFLSKNHKNKIKYIQYTPKSSKYFNVFQDLAKENQNFETYESVDSEIAINSILEIIAQRKNDSIIEDELLIILPQINVDSTLNVRTSPLMAKIKAVMDAGPIVGVFTMVYIESYNSFSDISSINNLCKFKIALKGGDSHKILSEKVEVEDDGFIYLNAPTPYTIINPDYINVYNSYRTDIHGSIPSPNEKLIAKIFDKLD